MSYVKQQMSKGDVGEKTAANMFRRLGYEVIPSTQEENKLKDIDGFLSHIPEFGDDSLKLDGASISIKNEEEGSKYGDVYFEVASHVKPSHRHKFPCCADGWIDSVLHYSAADYFVIIQPIKLGRVFVPSMMVLAVDDVRERFKFESYHGSARVLGLSQGRRASLAGVTYYPFDDALCYYMKRAAAEEMSLINIS